MKRTIDIILSWDKSIKLSFSILYSISSISRIILSSVSNFLGSNGSIGGAIGNIGSSIGSAVGGIVSAVGFGTALRAVSLLAGAMPTRRSYEGGAWGSSTEGDWRVRLSVPGNFTNSPLLKPLQETNGFVFPYTPTINISSRIKLSLPNKNE